MEQLSRLRWFESSHSGGSVGNGGQGCVEAAGSLRAVRDSTDSTDPAGPAFVFSNAAWTAIITGVERGELDLSTR